MSEASWNSASADGKTYGIPSTCIRLSLLQQEHSEGGGPARGRRPAEGLDGLDNFNAALEKIKADRQGPISAFGSTPTKAARCGGCSTRSFPSRAPKFIEGEEILPGEPASRR